MYIWHKIYACFVWNFCKWRSDAPMQSGTLSDSAPNTPTTSTVHKPAKRQPGLKGDLGARQAGSTRWIALCCYPNVNGPVRNLSLNHSSAPIFLLFNYFRENIWVTILSRSLFRSARTSCRTFDFPVPSRPVRNNFSWVHGWAVTHRQILGTPQTVYFLEADDVSYPNSD